MPVELRPLIQDAERHRPVLASLTVLGEQYFRADLDELNALAFPSEKEAAVGVRAYGERMLAVFSKQFHRFVNEFYTRPPSISSALRGLDTPPARERALAVAAKLEKESESFEKNTTADDLLFLSAYMFYMSRAIGLRVTGDHNVVEIGLVAIKCWTASIVLMKAGMEMNHFRKN